MRCYLLSVSQTTLLDVLAGKKTGGTISGELLVNGLPRDRGSFFRIAGYVEQFDSHNEKSSVREAIEFSAMLRLPKDVTDRKDEITRRVDHVLDQLGLTRIQHELIGNANTGGISQAARKKVTIAVELVGEPGLLFLDGQCETQMP
jgi:ABC-type multidrug transport system ATPase subunit